MSLVGALVAGICLATTKFEAKKCPNSPLIAIVLKSDKSMGSATMGMFCITGKGNYEHGTAERGLTIMDHEWGHTIQNALVGPFMIIVSICSVIWCNCGHPTEGGSYYSYWTEN